MGTQIKIYLELFRDGKWVCKPSSDIDHEQSYYFFTLLAGVRNHESRSHITPIVKNAGLPTNLSDSLKYEWDDWKEDMHDANYLTLPELRMGVEKTKSNEEQLISMHEDNEDKFIARLALDRLYCLLSELEHYAIVDDSILRDENGNQVVLQPDQIRIVFWFDS